MAGVCYRGGLLALVAGVALAAAGCGPAETGKAAKVQKTEARGDGHNYKGRDWCAEHGMPESVCVQCDAKLAKKYKDKGDWCDEHGVPKSQCFKCDPKPKEQFAREYRDKYGEDPPATD